MRPIALLVILVALGVAPPARAQDWTGYKEISLDAVFATWDEITAKEHAGLTLIDPQKVRFVARYADAPKPCRTSLLQIAFDMNGGKDWLAKVPTTHCLALASDKGRATPAFVEDLLVPGVEKDAKVGGRIEIYALLVAYVVKPKQSESHPTLLITRFEPK